MSNDLLSRSWSIHKALEAGKGGAFSSPKRRNADTFLLDKYYFLNDWYFVLAGRERSISN